MHGDLNGLAHVKALSCYCSGCDWRVARTYRGYSIEENEEEDDKEVAVGEQGCASCCNSHENGHSRH